MGDWETFIDQIINKYDYDTNTVKNTNLCVAAAIYGKDGNCWAASKDFPELWTYKYEIDDWGTKITEMVDEVQCCVKAAEGVRKPAGEAGIRISNMKYMFGNYDDITQCTQCSRTGGGAAIGNTKDAVVIALWDKMAVMGDGQMQTGPLAAEQVVNIKGFLVDQGY